MDTELENIPLNIRNQLPTAHSNSKNDISSTAQKTTSESEQQEQHPTPKEFDEEDIDMDDEQLFEQAESGSENSMSDEQDQQDEDAQQQIHTVIKTKANKAPVAAKKSSPQSQDALAHLLSWRQQCKQTEKDLPAESFKQVKLQSIVKSNLEDYAQNAQAIFINAQWRNPKHPQGLTIEQFNQLRLTDQLMNNGMVFIWADKELMNKIMDHLETQGFTYVQIFSFVLLSVQKLAEEAEKMKGQPVNKDATNRSILDFFKKKPVDNKTIPAEKKTSIDPLEYFKKKSTQLPKADPNKLIVENSYEYFNKGKVNLLLLRKTNKTQPLELRHQRTSDVFFTLYDETTDTMDELSYECVYRMIETLLIKANYQEGEHLKMVELWAREGTKRTGWVSISQQNMS